MADAPSDLHLRARLPILLFSCTDGFGGAEVYLAGLATELLKGGRAVLIACSSSIADLMRDRVGSHPDCVIAVDGIEWDWTIDPSIVIARQRAIFDRLWQEHGPFVSFFNLNWINVAAGLIAQSQQAALVHLHLCPHRVYLSSLERDILSKSIAEDVWSVVSADNRGFLGSSLGLSSKDVSSSVEVVYNGAANIDENYHDEDRDRRRQKSRTKLGLSPECPVLLSVGRHDRQKGFEEAIYVLANLAKLMPQIVYIWIGGGPLLEQHRQMVVELRLDGHFLLVGEHPKVSDYYLAADVFYMPSKYEGFALSMLEASFYGTPTVMNDVSSAREFIPEELDVCLVPPLRSWEHVWRLFDLLSGPTGTRREIGALLKKRSGLFTRSSMYAAILARIDKLQAKGS